MLEMLFRTACRQEPTLLQEVSLRRIESDQRPGHPGQGWWGVKLSRRSIFGLAAGAAIAPIVPALPAAARPTLVINRIPSFRKAIVASDIHRTAQESLNYWMRSSLEIIALEPKPPYWGEIE